MKPLRSDSRGEPAPVMRPKNLEGGEWRVQGGRSLLRRRAGSHEPAKDEIALRVSVIDGANHMVYTDLRDRKGWVQPLAIDQALQDATRRQDVRDGSTISPPRVVRAYEHLAPSARSASTSATATPYQAGKANARAHVLAPAGQLEAGSLKGLQAKQVISPRQLSR